MSKLIDEVVSASPNRRKFLKTIGAAAAAVGAMSVVNPTTAEAQATNDVAVLNFALNLEYLEAEFYTYAVYGQPITNFGIGIDGQANSPNPTAGGTTTGGHQVTFSNNLVFTPAIAAEIGTDERAHVKLLRSALGSAAIAKPNINLDALGLGFGSESEFLVLSRIFEDIGVSAYAGAAPLLSTTYIQTAARILATEAEHVATIRTQIARLNVQTFAVDGADLIPPPSGPTTQYLSVNPSNGLPAIRTPGQVLYLAFGMVANATSGGFFPTGVNGTFTTSTGPATAANLN